MKSKIIFSLLFSIFSGLQAIACEVCQANQPKILKNITHGAGPQGNWDYIIISVAVVIVSITLILSLKFLIKPGEKDPRHIKNIVVEQKP